MTGQATLVPFYVFHRGPEGGVYQWEVARSDGAIVCGCTSEEAAEAIVDALKTHEACRDIIEQVGAA
jgi:hypothetical protein